jgi:hypothetical protein
MKKTFIGLMAMVLVMGLAAAAMGSTVGVTIDGQWYDLATVPTRLGFDIPGQTVGNPNTGTVQISGLVDADPAITYGLAVVDFGAPSTFAFSFAIPIVLPAQPTTVESSIVGGLTDFTGDGVALTLTALFNPSGYVQDNFLTGVSGTWSVGNPVSFGPGPAGSLYAYGPFAFGPAAGPNLAVPFNNFFTTSVAFGLSGGGDVAALTGFCRIDPTTVPVPPSLVLLGSGLLGLLGLRRKLN